MSEATISTATHKRRDFSALSEEGGMSLARQFGNTEEVTLPASAPAGTQMSTRVDKILEGPSFTQVTIDDKGEAFAKEWRPSMSTLDYIGDKDLILNYLYRLERKYRVTMPIKVCGIDPIVFNNVEFIASDVVGAEKAFLIPNNTSTEENAEQAAYELVEVDNDLYLSCLSECLDIDYLHSILAEATTSIKTSGSYIYSLVGLRMLALGEGEKEGRLLNTLRLNNYEMSVLISYMEQFPGMNVTYAIMDEHQVIKFVIGK